MKTPSPILGRRGVLRLLALAPAAAALTACSSSAEPDQLLPAARAAKRDARLADAIGKAHSELAVRARAVSAARGAHAQALQREIDRVNPRDPDDPPSVPEPPRPQVPGSADEAAERLRTAARRAQEQAAELAPGLSAHRAGLVGSVSASCASLHEVLA
ncbi:hypothetical protein [Saccharopolyspora griseoalba]|uniref:Uncharacterized protein n=1 Tax=Saccharopolyspora griseoalba TaxID=1431848 RepID=A0ABW2LHS6_9PSEU